MELEVEIEGFLRYGSLREVAGECKGRMFEGEVVDSVADRRGNRGCRSHGVKEERMLIVSELRNEWSVEWEI